MSYVYYAGRLSVKVVGIDPSLTASGYALIDDDKGDEIDPMVWTRVIRSKPDDGTLGDRNGRILKISEPIVELSHDADLIVIEGPSYGSSSPYTWDRAGLWWSVVGLLLLFRKPIVAIPPKTRAKWCTNNGNSGKTAIIAAMGRMWPTVVLTDDNDTDALALATMGAQHLKLGGIPDIKPWMQGQLDKIVWPV